MNAALMKKLGIAAGDRVRIIQDGGEATLSAALDDTIPADCVRVPAAHASTAELGAMFGTVSVARVAATEKVSA